MSNELWLSKDEMAELLGCSRREVERMAMGSEIEWRWINQVGRNGKRAREYAASSLPPEKQDPRRLQEIVMRRAAAQVSAEQPSEQMALALTTPQLPQVSAQQKGAEPGAPTSIIPPEKRTKMQARYRIIEPLLDWERGLRPSFSNSDGKPFSSSDELANFIGQQHGKSGRTLQRWVMRLKKKGEAGLVHKPRVDYGKSRLLDKRYPDVANFVLAKYGEGQYSAEHIYDILAREWDNRFADRHGPWIRTRLVSVKLSDRSEVNFPHPNPRRREKTAISQGTLRNFLDRLPVPLRDAPRMPRELHNSKYAPYIITNICGVKPNQIWVCDHRVYDILGVNDYFDGAKELAPMRIWETCIEDMRTRVIVGSVWDVTPSSATIARALYQAISRFGMPEIFYGDNGKDFKKVGGAYANLPLDLDEDGRVRMDPTADALLLRLGIRPKYCIPKHPQSKQIESYFATVSKRFDVIFGDSYTGRKPSLRPDACRKAAKIHQQFVDGKRDDTPLVPLSYLIELHRQWTEEFNRDHKHGGRGMYNRTPYQVMDELLPAAQRRIPDMVELVPLFWSQNELTVRNSAVCWTEGGSSLEYEGETPHDAAQLYLANGSKILVRRNPDNIDQAVAYTARGEFLVRLRSKTLVERVADVKASPTTERAIKYVSRLRGRLHRATQQWWSVIGQGVPTEMELLAQRAHASSALNSPLQLPANTTPPTSPNLASDNRKSGLLALRAAVGGATSKSSTAPKYVGDVVDEVMNLIQEG